MSVIGDLFINLRANLGGLDSDLGKAGSSVQQHSQRMSHAFREQSREASHSIELIAEGFGIHIPRAIRNVISQSSFIAPAFAAALSVAGVIAMVGYLASMAPHIKKAIEEAGGLSQALRDVADEAKKASDAFLLIGINDRKSGAAAEQMQSQKVKGLDEEIDRQKKIREDQSLSAFLRNEETKDLEKLEKERKQEFDTLLQMQKREQDVTKQNKADVKAANDERRRAGLEGAALAKVNLEINKEEQEAAKTATALAIAQTKASTISATERARAGKAGADAEKKYRAELEGTSKKIQESLSAAIGGQDEFAALREGLARSIADITRNIKREEDLYSERTRHSKKESDKMVADRAAAAQAIFLLTKTEEEKEVEAFQKKQDEITKILAQALPKIPQLALPPPPTNFILNPEYLDASKVRIHELDTNIQDLRSTTLGYLQQVMTPAEEYKLVLDSLDLSYKKQFISLGQLLKLQRELNPAFIQAKQEADRMAGAIADAFVTGIQTGQGFKGVLGGVLQGISDIFAEIARNALKKAIFGLFSNILGRLLGGLGGSATGGATADFGVGDTGSLPFARGGPVLPNHDIIVGESGPERWNSGAGGYITPNSQLAGGDTFYIDARGADAGVEQRVMLAMSKVENRAVGKSIAAVDENNRRRA